MHRSWNALSCFILVFVSFICKIPQWVRTSMIIEQYTSLANSKSRYFLSLARSLSRPSAFVYNLSKYEFKSSELFAYIPRYLYSSASLIAFDSWFTFKGAVCMPISLAVPNRNVSVLPSFTLIISSFSWSQF